MNIRIDNDQPWSIEIKTCENVLTDPHSCAKYALNEYTNRNNRGLLSCRHAEMF